MSDIDYLLWWQNIREMTGYRFDALAWHLSDIGNWFESFFVPAIVYWAIDRKTGVFCNLARNLALVCTQFLKTSICAYRPWVRDVRIVPIKDALPSATGFSFPSGHTVNVTGVFGGLAMCWKNTAFRCFAVFLVVVIGVSRNFLGVHTPQDVLGGFTVAIFALLVTRRIALDLERHPERVAWYLWGGVAVGVILLIFSLCREPVIRDTMPKIDSFKIVIDDYRCAGCWLGSLLGWRLERRFVRFETTGVRLGRRLLRGGLGALVMLVVVFPVFYWIERRLGKHWGGAAGMFVVQMYIMLVWPWVMKRVSVFNSCEREKTV